MKNLVREKMLNKEKTLGTFFELGSSTAVECLGFSGLDFIIVDTEHGPFNPQSALDFIRTAKLYNITPFARVQEISRSAILKLLDVGAMGIIVPCVKTMEDVEKIVEYGKYIPLGERGVANTAGSGFWFEDYATHGLDNYFEISNRETMLFPQCETVECLNILEDVVKVPGVDGIFIGPFDLSTAMGIPGQFDKPEFQDALKHIQAVCSEANIPTMIFAANEATAKADFEMGFDSVAYGMDATIFTNACRSAVKNILG